jgi:hypothetical protein
MALSDDVSDDGAGESAPPERRLFGYRQTADVLADLEAALPAARLVPAPRGFVLLDGAGAACARVLVPPVLRLRDGETAESLMRRARAPLELHFIVLLRAGAAALGLWRDDVLLAHKVFTRYTVRGHGKAQTTHRKTKGKSRYGARLRLQNARRLLSEVNARGNAWRDEFGTFDVVFLACPVRTEPELRAAEPAPKFLAGEVCGVPFHVHEPRLAELLAVRRGLERGVVEWGAG